MKTTEIVPLEDDEARALADWLRANHLPHTHIANEIGGSTRTAKIRALKAKRMGQTAGVWDYEVFVPIYDVEKEVAAYQELRIELKRRKGGVVSASQKKWGEVYEMAGIPCKVCHGATEAIEYIRGWIKNVNGDSENEQQAN